MLSRACTHREMRGLKWKINSIDLTKETSFPVMSFTSYAVTSVAKLYCWFPRHATVAFSRKLSKLLRRSELMSLFPEEKHFLIGKKSERLRDTLGNSSVYSRVDLGSIILRVWLVAPALFLSLSRLSLPRRRDRGRNGFIFSVSGRDAYLAPWITVNKWRFIAVARIMPMKNKGPVNYFEN